MTAQICYDCGKLTLRPKKMKKGRRYRWYCPDCYAFWKGLKEKRK